MRLQREKKWRGREQGREGGIGKLDLKFLCVLTPSPLAEAILLGQGEGVLIILGGEEKGVLVIGDGKVFAVICHPRWKLRCGVCFGFLGHWVGGEGYRPWVSCRMMGRVCRKESGCYPLQQNEKSPCVNLYFIFDDLFLFYTFPLNLDFGPSFEYI